MSTLLIRDLPEKLHRQLKERAAKHRRSMAKEAIVLLEEALNNEAVLPPDLPHPFNGTFKLNDEWIDAAKAEARA